MLTDAAAMDAADTGRATGQEVVGASGQRVRVDGILADVTVTLGQGPGGVTSFDAPVASEVRGPWLVVRSNEEVKPIIFPMAGIQNVEVTYDKKALKLAGGVILDVFGGLCLAAGTPMSIMGIAFAAGPQDEDTGLAIAVFLGSGVPLLAVGTALLIPGIFLTRSGV